MTILFLAIFLCTCLSNPILIAKQTEPIKNTGIVSIFWSGVVTPTIYDWIGVYCPPITNTSNIHSTYVTWINVSQHSTNGKGTNPNLLPLRLLFLYLLCEQDILNKNWLTCEVIIIILCIGGIILFQLRCRKKRSLVINITQRKVFNQFYLICPFCLFID
jgi:hypothetical protein